MSEYINEPDALKQQAMKDEALDKQLAYVFIQGSDLEHWLSIFNHNFLWVTTNT